jgi:hypothetical protein
MEKGGAAQDEMVRQYRAEHDSGELGDDDRVDINNNITARYLLTLQMRN